MTKSCDTPQNDDKDRDRQARGSHEQMKKKDVHNYGTEKRKSQWHEAVDEQKYAAHDLKRAYNEHVVGLCECAQELACQA